MQNHNRYYAREYQLSSANLISNVWLPHVCITLGTAIVRHTPFPSISFIVTYCVSCWNVTNLSEVAWNVSVTNILSNEQIHPWQFSVWKRNITLRCLTLHYKYLMPVCSAMLMAVISPVIFIFQWMNCNNKEGYKPQITRMFGTCNISSLLYYTVSSRLQAVTLSSTQYNHATNSCAMLPAD
jgi:hypothetical protein